MTYHHSKLYELQKTLKSGERYYICGVHVSRAGTRCLKNLPPTLAELCCEKRGSEEAWHRAHGYPVHYAIPVGPHDLVWSEAQPLSDIALFKEKEAAEAHYKELLRTHIKKLDTTLDSVTNTRALLQKALGEWK